MAEEREDWHPRYRALWEHCRDKPGAKEEHPWGDTVFKVKGKVFAFLGGPQKPGVTVKPPPEELEVLLQAPFIHRARYVGRFGWVSVEILDDDGLRLALDLVDDSYEMIKSRARSGGGARRSRSTTRQAG